MQHFTGPLLSEDSYHPFGGTMAALSSKAFGKPATRFKYNGGIELNDDLELNYYETFFRNYDAQIGRFTGVDLLAEKYYSSTPYHFGLNNPVYFNDPSGLKSGRMEKGPDGNYHVGWVTEMAWNSVGFFNMSMDGGFDDVGGNGGGNYTNITGLTSKQVLSWMGFGDRVGRMKGEVGIWQTSTTAGKFDYINDVFTSINITSNFIAFAGRFSQKSSFIDGDFSTQDLINIGISGVGGVLGFQQGILMSERAGILAKANANGMNSFWRRSLSANNGSIKSLDKYGKRLGIAGLALTGVSLATKYFDKGITKKDIFDAGLSTALFALGALTPVGASFIIGEGIYGVLDSTGVLDGIKSWFGANDDVVFKNE